jgi:hypothetical protein
MKTNNIKYNSNPAFGTKLKVVGPSNLIESLTNALNGGRIAQGGRNRTKVRYGIPAKSEPVYIAMDRDADLFEKELNKNGLGEVRRSDEAAYNKVFRSFFKGADKLNLTQPLRFALEGSTAAVKRFVSALKGGLAAQDVPQGIAHNSKKTFIAIGEEAKSLFNSKEAFLDAVGVAGPAHDKMVEDFFKNAQIIHVTE